MKSIRIKVIATDMIAIDVVCGCGRNCLKNETTGESSTSHGILVGDLHPSSSPVLVCDCGKRYKVVSQRDHMHVNAL